MRIDEERTKKEHTYWKGKFPENSYLYDMDIPVPFYIERHFDFFFSKSIEDVKLIADMTVRFEEWSDGDFAKLKVSFKLDGTRAKTNIETELFPLESLSDGMIEDYFDHAIGVFQMSHKELFTAQTKEELKPYFPEYPDF